MEEFARMGLRTLCIAYREVSPQEYEEWSPIFYKAQTSLDDREKLVAEAAELMERNVKLLGVTAIEDALQEEVPETIQSLRDAGLKIWMLTGDKFSTAVQIATSCNLISPLGTKSSVQNGEFGRKIFMCKQVHHRNFPSRSSASRWKIPLVNLFTHEDFSCDATICNVSCSSKVWSHYSRHKQGYLLLFSLITKMLILF